MTPIHIMLDLETWGTTPGSDIRSIGACVFDPLTGRIPHGLTPQIDGEVITQVNREGSFYVAVDNEACPDHIGMVERHYGRWYNDMSGTGTLRRWPLTRDPQTVQWWSEQSEEARAAFTVPVPLDEGLKLFSDWLDSVRECEEIGGGRECSPLAIWSHGAHFDTPILSAVYRACGLPDPIHYRSPRDTRTIFEAAGMDPRTCLDDFKQPGDIHHHALHDAINQARAVCEAYRRLALTDPLARQLTPATRIEALTGKTE